MFNLVKNELMKIFKRPGTYVMIGILVIIASIAAGFIKYQESGNEKAGNPQWEHSLKQETESSKKQLENSNSRLEKDYLKRQITINEYRMEHHISPEQKYSLWGFVTDASQLIQLAGLFTIIVSAGIVASEFSWGTIKLLLIRPIKRTKILLAKYIAVLLFALFLLAVLFAYSTAIGAVLFDIPDKASPYLNYYNGKVTEQNMILHLMIYYGLNSVSMIMLATMAFMISSVFRNSSLAIGLSIFLMFTGGQITNLLSLKFSWAKYVLFANTDLMQYFEGTPMVEGMTLPFSVMVLAIYFLIFQLLAFYVFQKRDVAA
ncbi:ABC transporter permease [Neobacillus sp. PS3-34]|uniref:ABC transporter permease n=1 Tax=Neobacillus sp. PS3-34 TaxID=3070678 RepID=UPI0027E0AA1A|nr:ABC transporter permease [Neobacillus sp. PS3-34]WML47417.1 ABC transporter permease [Neobacillus sp. PS3-34]